MRQIQMLVAVLYKERKYTNDLKTLALGLCEEAGEVGKAINIYHNPEYMLTAHGHYDTVEHELCDVLVYLCGIANAANIDLQKAMIEKLAAVANTRSSGRD